VASKGPDADVIVVGAGFAGTCASHALNSVGCKVLLIDRRFDCPDLFRAEKIEADQANIMRELGILQFRAPLRDPIGVIRSFDAVTGAEQDIDTVEQYGISYQETVNRLIDGLPDEVARVKGRVVGFDRGEVPGVEMDDGSTHHARFIVLATGGSDRLVNALGLRRIPDPTLVSMSFGFDIEPIHDTGFGFNGFNYTAPAPHEDLGDYLTVFRIGERMRANLFTQLKPGDDRTRTLKGNMEAGLRRHFPALNRLIGDFQVTGRVQAVPTIYARLAPASLNGFVAIGDEHQAVSPTTGTGLSRVLTDVKVLALSHATRWMHQKTVSARDVAAFYSDPEKVASDRHSLGAWMHYRGRHEVSQSAVRRVRSKLQLMRLR